MFDFDPFLLVCATPYGKAAGRWQAPSSRITSTVLQSEQGSTTSKHNKATWHLRFDASTEPLVVEQQHLDHFHRHVVLKGNQSLPSLAVVAKGGGPNCEFVTLIATFFIPFCQALTYYNYLVFNQAEAASKWMGNVIASSLEKCSDLANPTYFLHYNYPKFLPWFHSTTQRFFFLESLSSVGVQS